MKYCINISFALSFMLLSLTVYSQNSQLYGYNNSTVFGIDLNSNAVETIGVYNDIPSISGHTMDDATGRFFILAPGEVFIVDLNTGALLDQLDFPVVEIEYDPTTDRLIGYNNSMVLSMELNNGSIDTLGQYPMINAINGHAIDIKNGVFYILNTGKVYAINTSNGIAINDYDFDVNEIEYDPIGEQLIGFNPSSLSQLNLTDGTTSLIGNYPTVNSISGHAFDILNRTFYILNGGSQVTGVDVVTGTSTANFNFDVVEIEYLNDGTPSVRIDPITSICESDSIQLNATLGGPATSLTWFTFGSGSFDDVNSLSPVYAPGVGDIDAGSVWLFAISNDPINGGQCPGFQQIELIIELVKIPSFTQLGPYCWGEDPDMLPLISDNGVPGTWDTEISTDILGLQIYNFTPDSLACAIPQSMTIQTENCGCPPISVEVLNVECNNNGTIGNFNDDFLIITIIATNPNGGTYSLNETLVTPSSGTYGVAQTFNLNPGTAGVIGQSLLALIDDAEPGCLELFSFENLPSCSTDCSTNPSAGMGRDTIFCGSDVSLNLFTLLSGNDSDGFWTMDPGVLNSSSLFIGALTPGDYQITYMVGFGTSCENSESFTITIKEDIDFIDFELIDCEYVVLPEIQGISLTGNEAYFTIPLGQGIQYLPGDTIFETTPLFMYDTFDNCEGTGLGLVTIPKPDIENNSPILACEFYVLPEIVVDDFTITDGYFSQSGATGQTYNVGDTLFTSTDIYMYYEEGGCFDEELLNVIVLSDTGIDFNQAICPGQSLFINGNEYNHNNPTGTEVFTSSIGCDSILSIDLVLLDNIEILIDTVLCENEILTVGGFDFGGEITSGEVVINQGVSNGCDSIITVMITTIPLPSFSLDTLYCPGETITIEGVQFDENNSSGEVYLPNAGSNGCDSILMVQLIPITASSSNFDTLICPNERYFFEGQLFDIDNPTGEITFPGAASNGCDSVIIVTTSFKEITVDIQIEVQPDGETQQIILNTDLVPNSISWSPSSDLSCTDCASPSVNLLFNEIYTATINYGEGCEIEIDVPLESLREFEFYVPNAFSPNGNGINEVFHVHGIADIAMVEELIIFDRWGNPIFTIEDSSTPINEPEFGWNGRIDNQLATPGVYVYYIVVEDQRGDQHKLHGTVTLVR